MIDYLLKIKFFVAMQTMNYFYDQESNLRDPAYTSYDAFDFMYSSFFLRRKEVKSSFFAIFCR